ncbi:MAG: ATP-dependent Clp protease ATP-binding subunit [Candidatus Moranbacteria bacterium]|nr:ATP-dependent Clp protease ATP-binding subunit [Candidatus Moranbacteria bacterium]
MHKKNFLTWYYSDGLKCLFQALANLLEFILRFFSIKLLSQTLFYPWHKDVSLKYWQNLSFFRSIQKFFGSLFSRFVGFFVRIIILTIGLTFFIVTFVISLVIIFFYFAFPGIFVAALVFSFSNLFYIGLGVLFFQTLFLIIAYNRFKIFDHVRYRRMNVAQLNKLDWFYRIYERLGVKKEVVPKKVLGSFENFKKFLNKLGVTVEECEKTIVWEIDRQLEREDKKHFFSKGNLAKIRPIGLRWHFGHTVKLDKFSQDLTKFDDSSYSKFPFVGYQEEMNLLETILDRKKENNVIIAGSPGSGRRMLMYEFARRIRSGEYDKTDFMNSRVLMCYFDEAVSEVENLGINLENFIDNLFQEAAYAGNVILVIKNFEKYLEKDGNNFSFTKFINKYAPLTTVRIVGVTTEDAFNEKINIDKTLMNNFEVIQIGEMDEEETLQVLFNYFYGDKHTPFTFQALRQIIINSEYYASQNPLPLRAINLANEILNFWEKEGSRGFITEEIVNIFTSKKISMSVNQVSQEKKEKLFSLEDSFHKRVVGQDLAINSLASAVRRMRNNMNSPHRLVGSFLFLGPVGVGKMETIKILAEQYFGDENKIIQIDMNEFQEENALDKLIGSKNLNQQGILANIVNEQPYSLLLFDEIEKANSEVLDIFLQILNRGFVVNVFGQQLNFNNMIIVATSNAGTLQIRELFNDKVNLNNAKKEIVDNIVKEGVFHPEFTTHFDDVIIFQPLNEREIFRIVEILLEDFSKSFKDERHIEIVFGGGVVEEIIERGFDQVFGAKSLIRYIQDDLFDFLAKKIIAGNVQRGDRVYFSKKDME